MWEHPPLLKQLCFPTEVNNLISFQPLPSNHLPYRDDKCMLLLSKFKFNQSTWITRHLIKNDTLIYSSGALRVLNRPCVYPAHVPLTNTVYAVRDLFKDGVIMSGLASSVSKHEPNSPWSPRDEIPESKIPKSAPTSLPLKLLGNDWTNYSHTVRLLS